MIAWHTFQQRQNTLGIRFPYVLSTFWDREEHVANAIRQMWERVERRRGIRGGGGALGLKHPPKIFSHKKGRKMKKKEREKRKKQKMKKMKKGEKKKIF